MGIHLAPVSAGYHGRRRIIRRGGQRFTANSSRVCAFLVICLVGFCSPGLLAKTNPRGTTSIQIGGGHVEIEYGRPSLHGRDVLKLIEPGQLWRLGADAPTTLESSTDLNFGGTRISRGKHILLVRYSEPGVWSLVISKAPAIQYEPASRLAETLLRFERVTQSTEVLSIHLSKRRGKGEIAIAWGRYRLKGEFAPVR
ncbi:MAG TPA: DUF2911 domain-containing protein [Terriglobia bacterium]|nr:DUF2911 domain-containing protein [Terriglobia bacterium]